MSHNRLKLAVLLISFFPIAMHGGVAHGQDRGEGQIRGRSSGRDSKASSSRPAIDEIPAAALLTDRGRQLADQLRHLRRAKATMGPKHPSYAGVLAQIAKIKKELAAETAAENPLLARDQPPPKTLAELSDQELRQLILQMAVKIAQLEARIEKLEQRNRVH